MNNGLTPRQELFAKQITAGNSATKAAVLAGYSKKSARFTASKLLTNTNILQRIEEIFDKAGLSDEALVQRLKTAIDAGLGTKANNSDAIKGLKMAFELKSRFPQARVKIEARQDEHILKLEGMSDDELINELERYTTKTQEYLVKMKKIKLEEDNQQTEELQTNNKDANQDLSTPSFPRAIGKAIDR
jgi:phage terminase small subunit